MLKHVTAALIAGGKSERFGSPKCSALYSGKSLLDHALEKIQCISEDAIIIGDIPRNILCHPVPVFKDIVEDCGPIAGIYTALHFSHKKWIAVLPVDMPLLPISVYRFLYTSCRDGCPVVARSEKGLEPLVSLWPIENLSVIKDQIDKKDFRLHFLLKMLNSVEVDLSRIPGYNPLWFENINYKKDLKSLEISVDQLGIFNSKEKLVNL